MDLLQTPADDHLALIGCALAFFASAGMMYLSYFVGHGTRSARNKNALVPQRVRYSQPSRQGNAPARQADAREDKAA